MSNKYFYRLHRGLKDLDYQFYLVEENPIHVIKNFQEDWYESIYYYTEEQVTEAEEIIACKNQNGIYNRKRGIGSVTDAQGRRYPTIENVVTNKLVWDFDDKENPDNARNDTKVVVGKLQDLGIPNEAIAVAFSGGKGFSVVVETTSLLNPAQVLNICANLAKGLKTFDPRIYNPSRIFRVVLTKHNSGLYKTPLPLAALEHSVETIKQELCVERMEVENYPDYDEVVLPEKLARLKEVAVKEEVKVNPDIAMNIQGLDWTNRVKYLTPEKWVLSQGLGFGNGERHEAYLCLASSYKAAGHDAEKTYSMIKDADRRHSAIFNRERFPKEELWFNIIGSVFSDNWKGGTYGPGHPILARIRTQLPASLLIEKEGLVGNDFIFDEFRKFSVDIEKNTIKTGISDFDKKVKLLTGCSISLLGSPGSGKTTFIMNILRNTSKNGEASLFFSLDMNASLIVCMMIRDFTGYNIDKVFLLAKENPVEFEQVRQRVMEVYKNVGYSFKFGLTPADIREHIHEYERINGRKVRMIAIDYLENVASGHSDVSVGAGIVAQQIANICADEGVLGITLMQTQKRNDVGEPLDSLRDIKGGSQIEQSISVGIGIHRPGQKLAYKDYDNYIVANIIKNRFGPLATIPMHFDGEKAKIRDLTKDERSGYTDLLDLIESDKQEAAEDKKNEWKNNKW